MNGLMELSPVEIVGIHQGACPPAICDAVSYTHSRFPNMSLENSEKVGNVGQLA